MKKILLLSLLVIMLISSFASAASILEQTTFNRGGDDAGQTGYRGIRFNVGGQSLLINNVTKVTQTTCDTASIMDSTHTLFIANATFSGLTATFNNFVANAFGQYYIVGRPSSGTCTVSFQNSVTYNISGTTYLNFTGAINTGVEASNNMWLFTSLGVSTIGPTVSITNPTNNTNLTNVAGQTINATNAPSPGATTVNATVLFYNALTGSLIGSNFTNFVPSNKTNWTMPDLGEGIFRIDVQMCENNGVCSYAPQNVTYTVDSQNPIVNIFYPTGTVNGLTAGQSLNLNFSVVDTSAAFCWRVYNGVNTTISCTANSTISYASGVNSVQVWSNDSTGHTSFAISNWTSGIVINYVNYSNTTFETSREMFTMNFSSPSILSASAILVYNGTNYPSSVSCSSGNCTATNSFDIPIITSGLQQNLTFYWAVTSYNGTGILSFNTVNYNQSVKQILLSSCTAGVTTLNFTAYDEQNRTRILPNNMFSFDGSFQYYTGLGTVFKNISITNSSTPEVDLCISQNTTYYTNAIIAYSAPNSTTTYTLRNYFYQNYLINQTMRLVPLYLLRTASSTSFILQVQDRFVQPVTNVLVNAQRCYPGTNTNETVFISRTDSNGLTTGNLEAETALYQFLITNNSNTLLSVIPCSKVVPQTTPYTLLFQLGTGYVSPFLNVNNLSNINATLIYNYTSNILTLTYVDTSGNFSLAELIVRNLNASGSSQPVVCDSNNTLAAGVITCNVSVGGSYFAQAIVYRTDRILVDQITFDVQTFSSTVGYYGAFLGFFLLVISAFAFKFNEIAGIWLMDAMVIFLNITGLIGFGKVFITAMLCLSILITAVLER